MGFDIMIDDKLKPWLLEVNSSPAMSMDGLADKKVKPELLRDTLKMINFEPFEKYDDRINIWNKKAKESLYPHKSGATTKMRSNPIKTNSEGSSIQRQFFDKRNQSNQVKKRMDTNKHFGGPRNTSTHNVIQTENYADYSKQSSLKTKESQFIRNKTQVHTQIVSSKQSQRNKE